MKKTLMLGLVVLLFGAMAQAATITIDVPFGDIFSDGTTSITPVAGPGLNPLWITSIDVSLLTGSLNSSATFTQNQGNPDVATLNISGFTMTVTNFNGGGVAFGAFNAPDRVNELQNTPAIFPLVTNNVGPTGTQTGNIALNTTISFDVQKTITSSSLTCGTANCTGGIVSYVDGIVRVVYNYEIPNNDVPEPGTFAMMGAALVGVAALARRRK